MRNKLVAINILSLFDSLSTLILVLGLGVSNEANPTMAALIDHNPLLFIIVKALMVLAATAILAYYYDRKRNARRITTLALGIYLTLGGWHILLLLGEAWK